MPSTPWAVQRSQRKQPSTDPPPRKRVRTSDDVGRTRSSKRESKDQRTLTQIQWVNSPQTSFEDEAHLQEVGLQNANETESRKVRSKKANKRDSTLTQMDWLGGMPATWDDNGEDMDMLVLTHDQEEEKCIPANSPQLDNAHNHPRRKRKRHSGRLSTPVTTVKDNGIQNASIGNPNKGNTVGYQQRSSRRRSSRIASKAGSNAAEDTRYTNFVPSPKREQTPVAQSDTAPELEIKDTMGPAETRRLVQAPELPRTPRQRRVVPSSQTPETLPNTKRRLYQVDHPSPSKSSRETPLREKSINIQPRTYAQGLEASKSMLGVAEKSPRRRKVCVLKVPSKNFLKRFDQTEDSQCDVFSLPVTPYGRKGDLSDSVEFLEPTKPRLFENQDPVEIPPTSDQVASSDRDVPSSPPVVDTQASLPELSDLFPARRSFATKLDDSERVKPQLQGDGDGSVLARDFGPTSQRGEASATREQVDLPVAKDDALDHMLLDNGSHTPRVDTLPTAEKAARDCDADSDLGSPVANDTQFNVNLLQRTSSPSSAIESVATELLHRSKSASGSPTPKRSRQTPSRAGVQQAEADVDTPIPTPKLVQKPGSATKSPRSRNDQVLTSDKTAPLSDGYETVSTEPLNRDVQRLSSLSPMLPPARPMTQRSVHPASVPRPSQVSTQAPTQGYLPSSAPASTQQSNDVEGTTIKDSSSIPPRLSQIPNHNLRLGEDSDDEIDDLDLDPGSSLLRGKHSARKRRDVLRNTASSLKSIHLPLSKSSQRVDPTQGSSSPRLEPLMPPSRRKKLGRLPGKPLSSENKSQPQHHQTDNAPATRREKLIYNSDSDLNSSSPPSPPNPPPLKGKYDPIPGFDNDTQSNFTQDGHVTAAYIHREREAGRLPDWFTPAPHQVPNWTGRAKDRRQS